MSEWIGAARTAKYVECAILQQKCGEHNVCKEIAHDGARWKFMVGE